MRFFNVNKMKDMAFRGFITADAAFIGYSMYNRPKIDAKKCDEFRKKYPDAKIYVEPRVIAGMAGANYTVVEDKETGKIIARW